MCRRALAAAIVIVAPSLAHADRSVTGTIVDDTTGAPVVGALVSVGAAEATTDDSGRFSIPGAPFGRLDLLVIADGYQAYFGSARAGGTLAIRLVPEAGKSEVIHVSGQRPSAPPLHLDTEEIRNLPGAGNDALRALQSLPGVARTPFGLGGLALRGTAPRDTKVYLDGIEVPLLYHFGGIASFLPTAAVDELTLEPGGASVRYGRGLGGVAVVTSRTGRGDQWRAGGEISLIHAAAIAEGPGPLKGSWLVAARRSYFDAIEDAANLDLALAPRYGDAQLRWESGDGRWMAILFGSDDNLRLIHDPNDTDTGGINTSNVKSFDYSSRFARLGMRYRAVSGATQLTIIPSVGIDDIDARANHDDLDKGLHRTTIPLSLRAEVATPLAGGTVLVGVDGGASRYSYSMLNTPPPNPADPAPAAVIQRDLTQWGADLGGFIEQSWFLFGDDLELRPGVRGDHFGLSEQWTLDPRLAVRERLPYGISLSQQIGIYHEPPLITDLDPVFMRKTPMLGSKATQVALGAKAIVGDDSELSATAYYQDLAQLPVDAVSAATPISANGAEESGGLLGISRELVDTQFGSYSYREAIGTGHAYGIELIARRNTGRWTGWIAYTYSRSWRQNPVHGPGDLPYVLDQPHSLTVLATTALGDSWRFGGRFRYTTGNPFTPVDHAVMNGSSYTAIDGPLLSERLPAFVQLDLRLDHAWRRSWGVLDLYIDVQNVTNRDNPEGVTYNKDYTRRSYTTGLPVFPSIGVEYIP
ncbi:MAG TPA: TonB-dependent receptor [Kofleriaceae bacterium]|nr:TonB-dependent receptor [Kofleriaceae bacterium]